MKLKKQEIEKQELKTRKIEFKKKILKLNFEDFLFTNRL